MMASPPEFADRYDRWMDAVRRKDMPALEQILAPEYTYTATGQGRLTRRQWLDLVAAYDLKSFSFPQIEVATYANFAIANVEYRQEALVRGEARSGSFLITDVWIERQDRWQVLARSSIYQASSTVTS